jgi:hypothetical protein
VGHDHGDARPHRTLPDHERTFPFDQRREAHPHPGDVRDGVLDAGSTDPNRYSQVTRSHG